MIDLLKWYLLIQALGLINLPITISVFQKLRSKGVFLSKILGLLLWGFVFWWLVTIGLLRNDLPSALVAMGLLTLVNLFFLKRIGFDQLREQIISLKRFLIASELVFLIAFAFWAFVRSTNPEIIHTEKFMEMAFINAILKSPGFPPHDPWLSGYGISYYYFGYVLSALLIRVSGVASSVGYNLVSALWFGMTALAAYGLVWEFLTMRNLSLNASEEVKRRAYFLALLAPIMLLIVSNWFGLLDVLHARGFLGEKATQLINLLALNAEPFNYSWFPNRGGWSWWQASRVLQDYRLNGSSIEIIDEFPFFTFLLSDIHPHLLGMPFVILAIAMAFNAFMGGWEKETTVFGRKLSLNIHNISLAVITLGGIAFLNTWDFPFHLLLIAFSLVWKSARETGWQVKHLRRLVLFGLVGGVLSILAYLPFYLSFASQAGGILPSLAFFTSGIQLWTMFGPLLTMILVWLIYRQIKMKRFPGLNALLLSLALVFFLFMVGWGMGLLAGRMENLGQLLNALQGAESNAQLLKESLLARLKAPAAFITLLLLVWLALDQLLAKIPKSVETTSEDKAEPVTQTVRPQAFILMLILLGSLLVIVPEFIYLKDQFATRMNTIFKFYFQAWILWSLAAAFGLGDLFFESKGRWNRLFALLIAAAALLGLGFSIHQRDMSLAKAFGSNFLDYLLLSIPVLFIIWFLINLFKKQRKAALGVICSFAVFLGLIYPSIELWNKTEGFVPHDGYSLDGKQDFYLYSPDEMLAAAWLQKAPLGVMAETVSDTGGSYTTYNIISTFSGMPTVLGWIGHEAQWRGGYEEMGSRQNDLRELYSTASWEKAKTVIDMYNIRYIVVGELERQTYMVDVSKFDANLVKVFDTNSVDIYEVRQP